jgi:hypothetical protein
VGRDRGVRGLLLLAAALAAVAFLYGALSPGTYQDDDLDRYYMARELWRQPALLLDAWGMPLALLLFAVPARLFGFAGVEAVSALATGGAAFAVARAARSLGLPAPWLAAVFLFFQPIVLTLSFGGVAEPVAALVLACVLWAWYAGRISLAVILAGLLPLARIETGVLTLLVLLVGWSRVGWRARGAALLPLLLWNGLGAILTGDLLYILARSGTRPLHSLGSLHYARYLIVIAGPVVLFYFLWSLVGRGFPPPSEPGKKRPGFPALAALLFGVHVSLLTLLAWEALPFGRSIGFLRHVAATSPALALVAVWGVGDWVGRSSSRPWMPRVLFSVLWTAMVGFLLSGELIGHSYPGPGHVPMRWVVTAILAAGGIVFLWRPGRRERVLVLGIGLLAAGWALVAVRPIPLNSERKAIQSVVEYLDLGGNRNAVVYTNHPWFVFLAGRDRYDLRRTPHLTKAAVAEAPVGSLLLWENHYGPRLWGDVSLEELRGNPRLMRLMEAIGGREKEFRVVLFRVTEPPALSEPAPGS